MVTCTHGQCTFRTECRDADAVLLCGDCIGLFSMQASDHDGWMLTLHLPPGRHHFRYYAKSGTSIIWHDRDEVVINRVQTDSLSPSRDDK